MMKRNVIALALGLTTLLAVSSLEARGRERGPRSPRRAKAASSATVMPAALVGWGVSAQLEKAFHVGGGTANGVMKLWNMTAEDVFQDTPRSGGAGCTFTTILKDRLGSTVREETMICTSFGTLSLPAGTVEERDFSLTLNYLNATTGHADGDPLDPGYYVLEAIWEVRGPNRAEGVLSGVRHEAKIGLLVE